MMDPLRWPARAFGSVLAVALAACQGNLGSGGGLSIPQTPYGGQGAAGVPGPAGAQPQSRQRILEGAVSLRSDSTQLPLPSLDGFAVTLTLGTPVPSASPSDSPAASSLPSASPSPASSAPASASPRPSAQAGSLATPDGSHQPKTATKITLYPDAAPPAPTPQPSGDVQTFVKRSAIVRGYLLPASDLTLFGLGAVRFTIPKDEQTANRGFTVAVFEAGKKHHDKLMASDGAPSLSNDVVASGFSSEPIVLKANVGYLFMLYGDELAATPAPAAIGYPSPGNNPFVTPMPSGFPASPGGSSLGPSPPPHD